jgi:hypothetical protein
MFQVPWMTTMTIAATWVYRSLSDFGSSNVYMYDSLLYFFPASVFTVCGQCPCSSDELLPVQSQPMSEFRCTRAIPTPLPCIRVAVYTAHEQYPTS